MSLLTLAQLNQLILNSRKQRIAQQDNEREIDFHPVVKLFTPDAHATWLLAEADCDDPDRLFGLCDLGLGFPELGCVSLTELTNLRGPFGFQVERDRRFVAKHTLSAYTALAQAHARIVT
jgi:Protein of unknown function (DUF2958)